jgi:hypothetical protein
MSPLMTNSGKVDFLSRAREALSRAKQHLASDTEGRLRYAALDLRLALEAMAYQTAQAFDELPETAYEKWQPNKLVELLLEHDPHADQTVRIRISSTDGDGGSRVHDLGEDRRTPVKVLKDFYHRLGSMLHTPTLVQIRQGKDFDESKAQQRCEEVAAELERVITSPIRDVRFKNTVKFECVLCRKLVIRGIPIGVKGAVARCSDPTCHASYDVEILPEGQATWSPRGQDVPCPSCKTTMLVFENEVRHGATWTCLNSKCNAKVVLRLGVVIDGKQEK